MENVAEITQAETEEKEGAKYITVPEDELQAMLQAAAKEAIKELRKEEAKEKKKKVARKKKKRKPGRASCKT